MRGAVSQTALAETQFSVVNVLGLAGVDNAKVLRRIAPFPAGALKQVETVLRRLLAL